MVWPHPRDVILFTRSSYYYDDMFINSLFLTFFLILKPVLVFNPEKIAGTLPKRYFLDVKSTYFPSLVPCLQFTLRNVAAKAGNRR